MGGGSCDKWSIHEGTTRFAKANLEWKVVDTPVSHGSTRTVKVGGSEVVVVLREKDSKKVVSGMLVRPQAQRSVCHKQTSVELLDTEHHSQACTGAGNASDSLTSVTTKRVRI